MSNTLPKVLVICDDTSVREQLVDILRKETICSIIDSPGGKRGIEEAVSTQPDLIVALMSTLDISSFCSILQLNPETAYIPTVAMYNSEDVSQDGITEIPPGIVDRVICPLTNTHKFLDTVKLHLFTKERWIRFKRQPVQSGGQPYADDYYDFITCLADSFNLDQDKVQILSLGNRNSIYESAANAGIDEETLARYLADHLNHEYYPMIDPDSLNPDAFPIAFSRSKLVLAIYTSDRSTKYILSNPFDLQLMDTIDLISEINEPRIAIAQPDSILALLKTETPLENDVEVVSRGREEEEKDENGSTPESRPCQSGILEIDHEPTNEDINTSPIKYIADRIMYTAVNEKASDIHIEPKAGNTVVRYRIDGDMTDKFTLKPKTGRILLSRFKVLANMDIAEKRKPQDGALEARITGRHFKMRLATTSTPYGESLVIRLLDMESKPMKLSDLGMTPEQSETMCDVSQQHTGAIIVVGTTGSGKSTTLYSLISNIDIKNKSLMTIEDPVEYVIKNANQQQINEKAGVTFEALLKSAVRQDPDIIYLGEIRDPFTAKTIMDLASTGHLTFGTLHSANSTTAIGRLERLGISRADLVDSILLIESQRLIKRLCPHCRKIRPIKPDEVQMIGLFTDSIPTELADPVGCSSCRNRGYIGRQGIYEIMRFDPEVISIVKSDASVSEMRKKLHDAGQYLMSDHAIDLLRDFSICYADVYHLVFLEEKRLTGSITKIAEKEESKTTTAATSESSRAESLSEREPSVSPRTGEVKPFAKSTPDISAAEAKGTDTSGSNILIVDDDPDLREFISFILSKNGFNVTSTGDGVDAIVTLSSQEFDLIISDVDMPNLNGFKLLEVINDKGIKTPVVFLTGRDNKEDEIKGYELGAIDYIRKPIHKNTLLMRIKRILK